VNDREIAARIRDAYCGLAAGPGDFIPIADLADASGIPAGKLAAALIHLYEDQLVNLILARKPDGSHRPGSSGGHLVWRGVEAPRVDRSNTLSTRDIKTWKVVQCPGAGPGSLTTPTPRRSARSATGTSSAASSCGSGDQNDRPRTPTMGAAPRP
jgi:hypothetical protein